MTSQPDQRVCVYGAQLISKYLKDLPQEIEGAKTGGDIEHVHRMRVATRRLRSSMPMFRSCIPKSKYKLWLKEIQNITKSLGSVRDFDVKIDCISKIIHKEDIERKYKPGLSRIILRLSQRRNKLQDHVHQTLDSLSDSNIVNEMVDYFKILIKDNDQDFTYTHALYDLAYKNISTRLTNMLYYEDKALNPVNISDLHKMRIAVKYLRYTLETFSRLYNDDLNDSILITRKLQEILGDIHDCDVWLEFLPNFTNKEINRTINYYGHSRPFSRLKPGLEFFTENRQEERYRLFDLFYSNWLQWQSENVWDKLNEKIYLPIKITESIYPTAQTITLSTTIYPLKPVVNSKNNKE